VNQIRIDVCGKQIQTLSTIGNDDLESIRGRNDKPESKKKALTHLLNSSDRTVDALLSVFDLEKALAILISPEQMDKIESTREFMFDDPEENELQFFKELIEKIIKPTGLHVTVANKTLGIQAEISFHGMTTTI
jgi:hypothetical protein